MRRLNAWCNLIDAFHSHADLRLTVWLRTCLGPLREQTILDGTAQKGIRSLFPRRSEVDRLAQRSGLTHSVAMAHLQLDGLYGAPRLALRFGLTPAG
jgi:hypothetical protein